MPNQVGCLPFFPVMPHNHSSPGMGGQLDETSWGSGLLVTKFYFRASDNLQVSNDNETYTNDPSGLLLKEITISSLRESNYIHFPTTDIFRIKFDMRTTNALYQAMVGVYKNKTLVGTLQTTYSTSYITISQDVDLGQLAVGDKIQIWGLIADPSAYCYIRNFRLYFATALVFFTKVPFSQIEFLRPQLSTTYNPFVFSNTLT